MLDLNGERLAIGAWIGRDLEVSVRIRHDHVGVTRYPSRSRSSTRRYPPGSRRRRVGCPSGSTHEPVRDGEVHPADEVPGSVERSCRGEGQIEGTDEVARVHLGLRAAAHRARDGRQAPIPLHEHRHERVRWPFVAGEHVRRLGVEREGAPAVVADDPGRRLEGSRAEPAREALDERDRSSVAVGGDERDRVAAKLGRRRVRVVRSHTVAERGEAAVLEQIRDRYLRHAGSALLRSRSPARRDGLGEQVDVGSERVGVDAQPLDDREQLQHREPL